MLGIGALLEASASALAVLKLVGGAYLVWLGAQLWRAPAVQLRVDGARASARGSALFRQGLLTAVSNPKALLFYGAFLPQFIEPARDLATQFVVMATVFVAIEIAVEIGLAVLANRIRPLLERLGRKFNRACGGLFVAMGLALPLTR
jgi:threonine/homoserine/homoserine lactone efflux protein